MNKMLRLKKRPSTEDIKKAYKKLARENHPDLNPGDTEAEKKFKEISEASSVLGDERKSNSNLKMFYEDMHFKASFGDEVSF